MWPVTESVTVSKTSLKLTRIVTSENDQCPNDGSAVVWWSHLTMFI